MAKTELKQHRYGLIGRDIEYSFSRSYFKKKFGEMGLKTHSYENFDINTVEEFPGIIAKEKYLRGLNVTIPYKESIIQYLDRLDPEAAKIGAVNTIEFSPEGLVGHNTDVYGFQESLLSVLQEEDKYALILGTGGASKAVAFALNRLNISFKYVSRNPLEDQLQYSDLNREIMSKYSVVINCSPLGTYPKIDQKPDIPYEFLGAGHLLFDLVYNPEITAFMRAGMEKGARTCNGKRMLELQAEKAWSIWNS